MTAHRVVVADFNHTLVREGALPAWCRHRLARGGARARLQALAAILLRGPLAVALDRLPGGELAAARIGLAAFAGAAPEEVRAWAREALHPMPAALARIEQLRREEGVDCLRVVSRGSPALAIEAWLETHAMGLATEIVAPRLRVRNGRLTAEIEGGLIEKRARAGLVPDGGVFLGDGGDERWARAHSRRFRFERI